MTERMGALEAEEAKKRQEMEAALKRMEEEVCGVPYASLSDP